MVEAAKKLVAVFVDCEWGKKHNDLSTKHGVKGYPTVVFTDPDGKEVARLGGQDAGSVSRQIHEVVEKYSRAPEWFGSWEKAAEKAKEEKKPVLYFFATARDDSAKLEEALADESLKELRGRFVLVRSELGKGSADAKRFKVADSKQPVLLALDAGAEKPEEKPLKKIVGKKTAKELKKELEAVLKKLEGGK